MQPTYTCIIADNDIRLQQKLIQYASELDLLVLDTPVSGESLVESYYRWLPDIIITNVLLDRTDGLTVCRKIKQQGFESPIIIVSQSKEPAHYSSGFEIGTIDYINTPVPYDRFVRAVNRAKHCIEQKRRLSLVERKTQRRIVVNHRYRRIQVDENEILFVEKIDKRQIHIYLTDGSIIESSSNLKQIQEQCSEWFISSHRSFLVNLRHVKAIVPDTLIRGNYQLMCSNHKQTIPLTRRSYLKYMNLLNRHQIVPPVRTIL